MQASNQPRLPHVGVIALPYHAWSDCWATPHHVLVRLASYFHVVWVDPAAEWRDIVLQRRQVARASIGESLRPGFSVYYPEFWLPKLYRPTSFANWTFDQRLRRARRRLAKRGCTRIILYLWHPQFRRSLSSLRYTISCYHIDDEYSFSTTEAPVDEAEARIIESVDQVFIHSPGLLEKKGGLNPHTAFVPQGVDYNAYASPTPEPADLCAIPHPRIGYTGVLKKQLDWPLICALATAHPEWSFVFVGFQAPHPEVVGFIEKLSVQANVHFLGGKPVHELPRYPQHFDVCIMPYRLDDYTKYISPLKLQEYMAGGQPIVAAPIRSLLEFAPVIRLARTLDEWSAAFSRAISPEAVSIDQIQLRRDLARHFDWEIIVQDIARSLCDRLGSPYKEQIGPLTPMSDGTSPG